MDTIRYICLKRWSHHCRCLAQPEICEMEASGDLKRGDRGQYETVEIIAKPWWYVDVFARAEEAVTKDGDIRMILKLSKLDHPEKGAVIHKSSDLTDFYAFSHGIQRKRRQDHPRTTQIQAFEQVVFFSLFFFPPEFLSRLKNLLSTHERKSRAKTTLNSLHMISFI